MKKYFHKKDIVIPIYKGTLTIVLANDKKKLKRNFKGYFGGDENIYAHSIFQGNLMFCIVLNFNNKYSRIKHGVIAHEALHIAYYLANSRGVEPDFNNSEPITYLTEWITDEVYKFTNKENFKVK